MSWMTGLEHFVVGDEPLAPYCCLRIGGRAEYFARPTNQDELTSLVTRCRDEQIALRLLGGGSNLLIRTELLKGVTIRLDAPAFCGVDVDGDTLTARGGANLSHVIALAAREGLAGMEPLVGIPGTVGGALHGNAGDRATSVGNWVHQVTVLTRSGECVTRDRDEMNFAYRSSSLNELAILSAQFRLEPENREDLVRRMQKVWIVKRSVQPGGERKTAYLFKDPLGLTAAELIEQAGKKGSHSGGASLFDRDPNFVVLSENASTADVERLIDDVKSGVSKQLGVDLETSLQIW